MNIKTITPNPPANFNPSVEIPNTEQPFRFWCQKVLPLVYDDSLSYYELLCKVVDYLNTTMENVNTLGEDVVNINKVYNQLQDYVNNYFSTLDVQEEINNKLDEMANNGELYNIIKRYTDPIVDEQNKKITVINEETTVLNEKTKILENRMDTFSSLPSGSTSGDAELLDIRTPAFGFNNNTNYDSAGNAVRGQITTLSEEFENELNIKTLKLTDFNEGGLYFDVNSVVISKETEFKHIFLYDVESLIIQTNQEIYLKKLDGTWLETIKVNDFYSKNVHANSIAIIVPNTIKENDFIIKVSYFDNINRRLPLNTYINATAGTFNLNEIIETQEDYFIYKAKNRCLSGKIYTNNINIQHYDNYESLIIGKENGTLKVIAQYSNTHNINNKKIEYIVLIIRRKDNVDISPEQANIFTFINCSEIINDINIVRFYTDVKYNGQIYRDRGVLVLPTNYKTKGTPTRLAIVCHGAGAKPYDTITIDNTGKILGDPQRVLTKLGYAVMDTYGMPYSFSGSTTELHYGNPLVLSCYIQAYDYVMSHYNLKKDGILLTGSSMGGLSMLQIIQNSNIPIKSAVGYCPCLDLFKQAYCNPWATDQRKNIAKYFKFTGIQPTFTNGNNPTTEEIEYFKNNEDKVIGYYPLLFNITNGSLNEILKTDNLPSHYGYSTDISPQDENEKKYYETLRNIVKIPLLIIHNINDPTVLERYSQYYINALKRNGQLVKLKTYPNGGHTAWNNGDDVTMTDINGNKFTCKESQKLGVEWLQQFE